MCITPIVKLLEVFAEALAQEAASTIIHVVKECMPMYHSFFAVLFGVTGNLQ